MTTIEAILNNILLDLEPYAHSNGHVPPSDQCDLAEHIARKVGELRKQIPLAITAALEAAAQRITAKAVCDCGMEGYDITLHDEGCEIILAANHARLVTEGEGNA